VVKMPHQDETGGARLGVARLTLLAVLQRGPSLPQAKDPRRPLAGTPARERRSVLAPLHTANK